MGASNQEIFAKSCDRIIIMKEGEIVDQGTYEEIAKKPYYNEIFVP